MFWLEQKADGDNLTWFWWGFPSLIPPPMGWIALSCQEKDVQEKDSFNNFLGSQQALCELFVPLHFFTLVAYCQKMLTWPGGGKEI